MLLNTHDDLPHPVPPAAFLRYKENYFFILFSPATGVFGLSHLNFEPGFDRGRFSCTLSVRGKLIKYANQIPFPADFVLSREIGDGKLSVAFVEPHGRFDMRLESDDVELDVVFTRRQSTFDFGACRSAAPDMPTFQEVMTLGLNLPYNHHQQGLSVKGRLRLKDGGETIAIEGYGYRDHSWSMRSDNLVKEHTWCGFNFPSLTIGAKTIQTLHRPGLVAREGYVADADGPRAFRAIATRAVGNGPDGLPAKLVHELVDVFGHVYTIESDVAERLAHVPLYSEVPSSNGDVYHVVENFCRCRVKETGEDGIALIELGRSSRVGGAFQ